MQLFSSKKLLGEFKPSMADTEAGVPDLENIQPKSRNGTAGTRRSDEGNTSGLLLLYEMQTKYFPMTQRSRVFFLLIAEFMN